MAFSTAAAPGFTAPHLQGSGSVRANHAPVMGRTGGGSELPAFWEGAGCCTEPLQAGSPMPWVLSWAAAPSGDGDMGSSSLMSLAVDGLKKGTGGAQVCSWLGCFDVPPPPAPSAAVSLLCAGPGEIFTPCSPLKSGLIPALLPAACSPHCLHSAELSPAAPIPAAGKGSWPG